MLASTDVPTQIADRRSRREQSDLEALAEQHLRAAPYTELRRISCEMDDGVLTLHGAVPRYYLKQHAYRIVAGLPGVGHVKNEIVVTSRAAGVPAA